MENLAILGGSPSVTADSHRSWPEILPEDRQAVMAVLERGVLCGANAPEITSLQEEWADYLGVDHCLALNSGTAALHCCAAGIGLRPGDEVIVPAFTFIATPMAMIHQGAVPVFCDIDPRTYNIDPAKIEELITERTRAIVPVHLHGLPADMDEILAIAEKHGLQVIEDPAQAHGALYKARKVGTLGACAGFSLNGTKNLSGGEGGLFVTNDPDVHTAARRLAIFGEDVPPLGPDQFRSYWSNGVGWNYRTQELSAAFARSQLRRLDAYNATAQRNGALLTEGLARLPGLIPPYVPDDRTTIYHKYRVRLDPETLGFDGPPSELRDRILSALRAEGVEAVVWQLHPLPASPVFRRSRLSPWYRGLDDEPLRPWDPAAFPETSRLLAGSIVLGSESKPLFVQEAELMERYVEAFERILNRLDAVMRVPHVPAAEDSW